MEPGLEDLIDQPSSEIRFIEEGFNFNIHCKEIAYHESGHFLFDCLVEKESLGFTKILEAQIHVDEIEISGNVKTAEDPKRKSELRIREFYLENLNRIAFRILALCAGYASYLTFIKKDEYYIGIYNMVLTRYKLEYFPTDDLGFDYMKVKKYLAYHGITEKEKILRIIVFTNKELIDFMSKPQNKCAMGYLKNTFLKNNKLLLQGNKIRRMKKMVYNHTKNIYLTDLLCKVGNEIKRLKENLALTTD